MGNGFPDWPLPLRYSGWGNSEYSITYQRRWRLNAPSPERIGSTMNRRLQKSRNAKRSVIVGRHKTSVSLEDAFWKSLHDIAVIRNVPLSELLSAIDTGREHGSLSSAIRVFVLSHYRTLSDRRPEQRKPHDEASTHEPGR